MQRKCSTTTNDVLNGVTDVPLLAAVGLVAAGLVGIDTAAAGANDTTAVIDAAPGWRE